MKKHNFSAGPSVLPEVALENAAKAIFDFAGTGLSVLSYSHRTKEFEAVLAEAKALPIPPRTLWCGIGRG